MADAELAFKLQKQIMRNESVTSLNSSGSDSSSTTITGRDENIILSTNTITTTSVRVFNPYTEFKEFTRKDIQNLEKTFKKYDVNNDKKLDLEELKVMMEKLQIPQTHLGLKEMIRQVDDDQDNKINFKEFLMIFRKAKNGELKQDSGLQQLCDTVNVFEIDVSETGVKGAKSFFEAQAKKACSSSKFEREIREEQEERRMIEEQNRKKREEFMAKKSIFNQ